ncbi:HNH endonuclease, partial [Proteus mirabilis]
MERKIKKRQNQSLWYEPKRKSVINEQPLCVMCQEQGRITAATVVDHITPHRLKEEL